MVAPAAESFAGEGMETPVFPSAAIQPIGDAAAAEGEAEPGVPPTPQARTEDAAADDEEAAPLEGTAPGADGEEAKDEPREHLRRWFLGDRLLGRVQGPFGTRRTYKVRVLFQLFRSRPP